MEGVRDKVVFITGAGGGLGRAYALHLAQRGAKIAVVDVDGQAARTTAEEAGNAQAFVCDVSKPGDVFETIEAVVASLGRIDVLINNAGGTFRAPGPMESFTVEQWNKIIGINLTGPWLCCQAVLPHMKKKGRGKIINISSTTFSTGIPVGLSPYIASKGGVVALTRALAREWGPLNITVNAIAPSLVMMDKLEKRDPATTAALRRINDLVVGQQCLPRPETPADLVGAVEFLVSDASNFITGQVLNVDGGWTHE
jgi:3-oxoacyl-[acyl-carrier protein] reductase